MIRLLGNIPQSCTIAFSGGVDSVAAADFFLNGRKDVSIAFFHHGTEHSERSVEWVRNFADSRKCELKIGKIERDRDKNESLEEYWRNERYRFLHSIDNLVITAHHLDDAIETWIFSSLHGNPRVIPYRRHNVVRPFLKTRKKYLRGWCERRGISWIEDHSNRDPRFMRNYIRETIMPGAFKVNPGLYKTIIKKYDTF